MKSEFCPRAGLMRWKLVLMIDIRESLFWRSDGISEQLFQADVILCAEGLRRLGPLVAAGAVVHP